MNVINNLCYENLYDSSFLFFFHRIGRRIPLVMYFLTGGVALLSTLPIVLTGKYAGYMNKWLPSIMLCICL